MKCDKCKSEVGQDYQYVNLINQNDLQKNLSEEVLKESKKENRIPRLCSKCYEELKKSMIKN